MMLYRHGISEACSKRRYSGENLEISRLTAAELAEPPRSSTLQP